ncbi:MAG: glucose 1-dehydrogenase [Pedosphaera sp.]|nr:glucose 1-dehydrogenase [Pedosphaera sp.]
MNIQNKAAVVTGAGSGVGRATALALARGGCHVLVNYSRTRDGAEETAEACRALGVKAIAFEASVANDAAVRAMMAAAVREFGRLDILVNNAGTTRFIPHADLEAVRDEDWGRIFDVNLKGPFQCVRAARPHLEADGGVIVNIASVAGITGAGSSIPYCASKAALINLTLALARTLGPRIRVNAVAPGFITGRWLEQGLGEDYEKVRQAKAEQALLGKVCDPGDVAAAILSLITGSDLVTGQVLVCDGGHTLGPRLADGIK